MSELKPEESRDSFNAASDANDSLEPGELKLTPPRSPSAVLAPIVEEETSRISKLENYQCGDHQKQNFDDEGNYYDNRRIYQNRRSPQHQRYNSYGGPKFRSMHFKNRQGSQKIRNFFSGKNKKTDYRNQMQTEHVQHSDLHKQNVHKSGFLRYTKTKPVIQWNVNQKTETLKLKNKEEEFQKDHNESLKHLNEHTTKILYNENLPVNQRRNSENFESKNTKSLEKISQDSIEKDGSSENLNRKSKTKSVEKIAFKVKKKKKEKEKRKKKELNSKERNYEPTTPPVTTKSTTPELKLEESSKKLKNSSGKKVKIRDEKHKRNQPKFKLSFVDDINFENDGSNDVFPLSKDESTCSANVNKIKIDGDDKSNDNSPDTDEYQDMWEEDAELTSSQISEGKTNDSPKEFSSKISKFVNQNPSFDTESNTIIENMKTEKVENLDEIKNIKKKLNKNSDHKTKDKYKISEDIFNDDDSTTNTEKNDDSEDEDKKDGFSTPLFVNPSPPSDMLLLETKQLALNTNSSFKSEIIKKLSPPEHLIEKSSLPQPKKDEFEPTVNPNQKYLFGMQDIYEQFIQSVCSAGIDLSSNDSSKISTKTENIIPLKEIVSPLELEATPFSQFPKSSSIDSPLTELNVSVEILSKGDTDESSSSSSSDSSDSSSSSSSTSSSSSSDSNRSTNFKKERDELTENYTKEDKKKLRALEKRLETLKGWNAMDDDEQKCFEGLKRVLESEINLLKRKYFDIEKSKIEIINNSVQPNEIVSNVVVKEIEKNTILNSNRDMIKIRIPAKTQNIPIKIWTVPIPQIFSIEEEIAKAKRAENLEKLSRANEESKNKIKSNTQHENDHSSSRNRYKRSSENRSPEKHSRDSNSSTSNRRDQSPSNGSPGRSRQRSSPYSSSKRNSGSSHGVRSRRKNYRSRSRSYTPPRKKAGSPSHWHKNRNRESKNKFQREFHHRGFSRSRSRSRSNSRSRFSRRRSISPYTCRRFSRSPQFRPPSPPSSLNNRSSGTISRSRSRSISPNRHHIQRLSPNHWNRQDINNSQYYTNEEYSYDSLSSNRISLDARINQELNIRPIGTSIQSYQSYAQFNSYNDYMPAMQASNATIPFNNGLYSVGYQQEFNNSNIPDGFESSYYYNTNCNEFQNNNVEAVQSENLQIDGKNNSNLVSSVAVQKGNVLEIVPAPILPSTTSEITADTKNKSGEHHQRDLETKKLVDKKKIPLWKEEVNRRQVMCACLKLNRENDATMRSILTINIENKSKEKKSVLFADGIRPGQGTTDETSTVYKKEKKPKKGDKNKSINLLQDNKENENLKDLINLDLKIDPELENALPPAPPPGSPPLYLQQPILIRTDSPEQLLYFHYDPVVISMYVSQIPTPIPPRLLNRNTNTNQSSLQPNGSGHVKIEKKSPSTFSQQSIDKNCHTINHPRLPIASVSTIGFNRFNNMQSFSKNLVNPNVPMNNCNFSMPPPMINTFQPRCFSPSLLPPRSSNLEQIKRNTVPPPPPFNPVVPPPNSVSDNTPAFSSDSGAMTSFFKKEIVPPSPTGVLSPGGLHQFLRSETKSSSCSPSSPSVS